MQGISEEKLSSLLEKLIEQIIESINEGKKLPWQEPFFIGYMKSLVNPTAKKDFDGNECPNGRPYGGMVNPLFLLYGAEAARKRHGLAVMDHRFVSRSQIIAKRDEYKCHRDASVKKGAKAIPIFFPRYFDKKNDKFDPSQPAGKGNLEKVSVFSGFGMGYVFNVADTNLVEIGYLPPIDTVTVRENPPIELLESTICGYPQDYEEALCIPHYNLSSKQIKTPGLKNAKSPIAYYSTRCHELAHQLQDMTRGLSGKMGSRREDYSKNELEAEMTAAFVMGSLGFIKEDDDDFVNSAAYIQGWLSALQNDPHMLLEAAQGAQRLGRMILEGNLPAVIKDREDFHFLPVEKVA